MKNNNGSGVRRDWSTAVLLDMRGEQGADCRGSRRKRCNTVCA